MIRLRDRIKFSNIICECIVIISRITNPKYYQ